MRYVIMQLVLIIFWNKDIIKIKAVVIILKILPNLKIHYLRSYEWEVWHYQKANAGQIIRAISEFSRDNLFANISVNE